MHAVFYCDGSAKQNASGYGVHGYTYSEDVPKRGAGATGYKLTSGGYVSKDEPDAVQVTPLQYFDGVGSFKEATTNNGAEVKAITSVLSLAMKLKPKTLLIKSDSEYALKGFNGWATNWAKNNWQTSTGKPVSNKEFWEELLESKSILSNLGIEMKTQWVKGHADNLGNIVADKLASVGTARSKIGEQVWEVRESQTDGYWKAEIKRSPLIHKAWCYFRTIADADGDNEYFLGNVGNDEDFLGKHDPNGAYAYVKPIEREEPIELVKELQRKACGENDVGVVLRIPFLYNKGRADDLLQHGQHMLSKLHKDRADLYFTDSIYSGIQIDPKIEPLTREQTPPRLSARIFESSFLMRGILRDYENDTKKYTYIDVTDKLYVDSADSKGVITKKLIPTITASGALVKMEVECNAKTIQIPVKLGIDAPESETLKKLGLSNPQVFVVLWQETDVFYRYATLIRSDVGTGVWCGVYSNQLIVR